MFGDDVMELFSRNLFLLTTLRRMWDSAASSGRTRAVRANVKAKRYGDLAKMVAFFSADRDGGDSGPVRPGQVGA